MSAKTTIIPPENFSWIDENKLAAMACPRSAENAHFLMNQNIEILITLSPETLPPVFINTLDSIKSIRIDIEEFEAPKIEDISTFLSICEDSFERNKAVGIHCRMGKGRTGLMAACYLVHFQNLSPDKAITKVRLSRPGSIETYEQERAIFKYHDYVRRY